MKDETNIPVEEPREKEEKEKVVEKPVAQAHIRRSRKGKYVAAILLLLVLCFSAGLAGAWVMNQSSHQPSTAIRSGADGNAIITAQEQDIAGVASKVSPSVVSILTKSERQSYFGSSQTQQGAGTGIVVSSDGYVMTNKHVVQGVVR